MGKHNQQPSLYSKKFSFIPVFLVLVTIVLCVLQITFSSRYLASAKTVSVLETDIALIVQENEALQQKIASASALLTLEEKAQSRGFSKNIHTLFITSPDVALEIKR